MHTDLVLVLAVERAKDWKLSQSESLLLSMCVRECVRVCVIIIIVVYDIVLVIKVLIHL